jgi:hypothetical protein
MPRAWMARSGAVLGLGERICGWNRRRKEENSREVELRTEGCGWRRYWRMVRGRRGRRSGNMVLVLCRGGRRREMSNGQILLRW